MKRMASIYFFVLLATACLNTPKQTGPEAVLAQMRADTNWINHLDSLAQIAIGAGAKCLDPVSHSFAYDGRTWIFNQDWGGVLEIPSDYTIEDDIWQAELSFHGTRAWSPDSLILVSFYAGLQCLEYDEFAQSIEDGLKEDGFSVLSRDEKGKDIQVCARSAEGINFVGRYVFENENGIQYSVSVQYPDNKAEEASMVIEMARRYPAGPDGHIFTDLK